MKKILLISVIVSFIFLTGCAQSSPNGNKPKKFNCTVESNDNIRLRFPDIHDINDYGVIELLTNNIHEYLCYYYGDFDDLTIELDYQINFKNDQMISVIFSGFGNRITASHPNHLFKTITVDLKSRKLIKISDIYEINIDFVNIYRQEVKKQIDPNIASYFDSYTDEKLIDMFKNADTTNSSINSYYGDDKIGISIKDLPYAIGEHLEIEINYMDLIGNLKYDQLPFNGR